jgi:hypothetical protein
MRRIMGCVIAVAFILSAAGTKQVETKAHVPLHKVQVCHKGTTLTVGGAALTAHRGHSDGQLPACDFANVFHTGDACPADANGNGFVDGSELANSRNDAGGRTPSCPAGTF